jgi:hypothetical protein
MNRIGAAWAFAVVVGGALVACSSSSGSSGGNNIMGPSCLGGAMPPVGGSQSNSACDQCTQSKCGSASGCVNTDCSGYLSCYCACKSGDTSCYTNCFGQLSSGSCGMCISSILSCETQSCSSACSVGFDAGLPAH